MWVPCITYVHPLQCIYVLVERRPTASIVLVFRLGRRESGWPTADFTLICFSHKLKFSLRTRQAAFLKSDLLLHKGAHNWIRGRECGGMARDDRHEWTHEWGCKPLQRRSVRGARPKITHRTRCPGWPDLTQGRESARGGGKMDGHKQKSDLFTQKIRNGRRA